MSKLFMAFLGTYDYLTCNYKYNNKQKVQNVRFIQEALISLFCKGWTSRDSVVIFLTKEAKERNWQDNGHLDKDGKPLLRDGLERRLKVLELPMTIFSIDIPNGNSEKEIWKIFEIIFEQIQEHDEILFDITHAFRSIPMLAMIILNYAKVMKNIQILGIYYGAFEVLGSIQEVIKKKLEDRNAPIFNLTSFMVMLDWTNTLDYFLISGDASRILDRIRRDITPILTETYGTDESAVNLQKFSNKLNYLTEIIRTCRGTSLIEYDYNEMHNYIEMNQASIIKPLNPLLEKITVKLKPFKTGSIQSGYAAVKWCIEHNLIQQGFTLLQECMITELISSFLSEKQIIDREARLLISQALNIKLKKMPETEWKDPASSHKEEIQRILNELDDEFSAIFSTIRDYRNDLNHAGFTNQPLKPKKFKDQLINCYEKLKELKKDK
ncbi:MAG: TIGR02221 family CRISPR-associated protein [Promethearchaeota archaeon]